MSAATVIAFPLQTACPVCRVACPPDALSTCYACEDQYCRHCSECSCDRGGFLGGIGSLFSSLGSGGFSGFLKGIGGILGSFGGFLAGGGSAVPGKSYIVGENGPERFTPTGAGTIVPGAGKDGSSKTVNLGGVHFYGVTDADSFRKSSGQITRDLGNAVSSASRRG
jgi:hypothetical protein